MNRKLNPLSSKAVWQTKKDDRKLLTNRNVDIKIFNRYDIALSSKFEKDGSYSIVRTQIELVGQLVNEKKEKTRDTTPT